MKLQRFIPLSIYFILTGVLLPSVSESYATDVKKNKTLYIGGFFAMSRSGWNGGQGTLPAIQIAFDLVNNRTDILPEHKLELTWIDTMGVSSVGVKYLFEIINSPRKRIMLIGPVTSRVTVSVADVAQHWNLMQYGFVARTAVLNDRTRFPYSYKTLPDDSLYNPVRIQFFKTFGWKRIATIHYNGEGDAFSLVTQQLIALMEAENMTVVARESFATFEEIPAAVDKLKERDARIIVASFSLIVDIQFVCEKVHLLSKYLSSEDHQSDCVALSKKYPSSRDPETFLSIQHMYRQGMYGPKYVWVLLGWPGTSGNYDYLNQRGILPKTCLREQIMTALEGHFVINFYGFGDDHKRYTVFDMQPEQYEKLYLNRTTAPDHKFGPFAFDAALTMAHVLNKSIAYLAEGEDLQDFDYDNANMRSIFQNVTNELTIDGLTGPIAFDKLGNRIGLQTLERFQGGKMDIVGIYHPSNNSIVFDQETRIVWKDNIVPVDGMTYKVRYLYLPKSAIGVISGLGISGVFIALAFLGINISKRKLKYIKLSSPTLNNIIIGGCILVYLSVIIAGVDGEAIDENIFGGLCTIRLWTLCIGFTAAFGAMFAKTWRVHVVMTTKSTKKMQRKPVLDVHLIGIVLFLLAIDILLLIIWMVVDPYHVELRRFPDEVDAEYPNVAYTQYRMACTSTNEVYWLGAVYIYKAIVMLLGLFMAWETRQVRIPALNDSKFIGMSVYNVALLSVIGAPVGHIMGNRFEIAYAITSMLIIFCTTITLGLVFVPKLFELRTNPEGNVNVAVGTNKTYDSSLATTTTQHSYVQGAQQMVLIEQKDKIIAELMLENSSLKEMASNSTYQSHS